MTVNHYIFNISESTQKHIKFKILSPIDSSLVYYLKSRKSESITPSKSKYFIMNKDHQFISSIYPLQKQENFTGKFELTDGGTYVFDYQNQKFSFTLEGQHIAFLKGDE